MKPLIFVTFFLSFLISGPVRSAPLQGVERVFAAENHVCARVVGGATVCWGLNFAGELGDGNRITSPFPVAVAGLGGVASGIDGGVGFTCAATTAGSAKCWGANEYGQLGNGSTGFE
ncbi:MAG: hypothetical protein ABI650_08700, partial [Dokdonella sp.]